MRAFSRRGGSIFGRISESHLILVPQSLAHRVVRRDEFAFAVGDGQVDGADAFGPDAFVAAGNKVNPPINKAAIIVVRQRAVWPVRPARGPGSRSVFTRT